jgi:hypothetical protein
VRLRPLLALPLLAGVALAAAVGTPDDSGTPRPPQAPPSSSATGGGDRPSPAPASGDQEGAQLAAAAATAVAGATAVHYHLVTGADRQTIDVRAAANGDCTGTVTVGEGSLRVLGVGQDQWFKADEAAWRTISAAGADDFIAAAGDRWVRDEGFGFADVCLYRNLVDNVFSTVGGAWFVAGDGQVDGREVTRLQNAGSGLILASVLVEEPHYLVRIEREDQQRGGTDVITFGEYDAPVDVQAPPDDQVVDLSR